MNMKATIARQYAKRIATECSDCFTKVKAHRAMFGGGKWEISINGGSGACYGKTVKDEEDAEDILRIFKNDKP